MTYPCPACRATASLETGCPGCGRAADPDAAEVIRLDSEIAALGANLRAAQLRRNELAARVRARVAPIILPPAGTGPAAPPRPEASTRTVQNLLFILGGLLLGTAAIVFTAVAWAAYGVGGRAVILAVVTAFALSAPLLALRRQLVATAETFAAVGVLLVVLDGYAAWYVNLFGLGAWPGNRYAALVAGVTAAVAAGYARLTGLTGPRYAALVAIQPVAPLLAADASLDAFGFALTFAALATVDLVLAWRLSGPLRVVAWVAYGGAIAASTVSAFAWQAPSVAAPVAAGLIVAAVALLRVDQRVSPRVRGRAWAWLLVPLGAVVLVEIAPALWETLGEPYAWLGRTWEGAPSGGWSVTASAAVALILVAVAVGAVRPMWAVPLAAVAVPVALAAADAPWPAVPAVTLALGLGLVQGRAPSYRFLHSKGPLLTGTGVVLALAGIAGSLATEGTTLGALGLTVIAAAAVGVAGRTPAARTTAWPVTVVAGVTFAVAAIRAGDLPWRSGGFAVLAVAAAALALGGVLAARRPGRRGRWTSRRTAPPPWRSC
ncbi:hypothetical protein [Phytohabitans rumicis]|uniref:Uncharacterized protein n=1 Tax=Phytohabitans rumicis TaxID=1076125 RepID=A0A6V8L1N7_9ACTN|nr:hypothetical protein [Phytohabitans rumicis]GFJ89490.1 hypothetical protein Prum_031320 [Phytohabitans rumicis]